MQIRNFVYRFYYFLFQNTAQELNCKSLPFSWHSAGKRFYCWPNPGLASYWSVSCVPKSISKLAFTIYLIVKGLPIPIKKYCQRNFKLASVRQLPLETLNFLPIAVPAEFFKNQAWFSFRPRSIHTCHRSRIHLVRQFR
jgi:hypothetical protein